MKRIYRRWYEWECYKAGFYDYESSKYTPDENCDIFKNYFLDLKRFNSDIDKVFKEWPISCENFLTNTSINRVAWLGQACVCLSTGVSSKYKYCYNDLPEKIQIKANELASKRIKEWENEKGKNIAIHNGMGEQMLF